MDKCVLRLSAVLLISAELTVIQAQFYDLSQGFQTFFQPYQIQNGYLNPYNDVPKQITTTNKPQSKKKQEIQDSFWSAPIHQYDYVFSTTTTPKPSRKPAKTSSQNNRTPNRNINGNFNFNFNDFFTPIYETTTKRNRVNNNNKKTTIKLNNSVTSKPFNSNFNVYNKATTEKVFENKFQNTHANLYNNRRPDNRQEYNRVMPNNRNPNVQNITPNVNRGSSFNRPTNTRNPEVNINYAVNTNTNNRQPYPTTSFNNNRGNIDYNNKNTNNWVTTHNYNRGNQNNRGILNTDYDGDGNSGIIYPGNPIINHPGVRPAPVDVNQPPITNKPVSDRNNYVPYNRPSNDGYGYTERPADVPEILIGPDEDDMTENQKRRYINMAERMCDRYKSLNVKELVALPLLPSPEPVEFNVSSCVPINVPLVIGGKVASIEEFPHMALVGWRKMREHGYSWKCGGSLISDRYVLTAGHCTYQEKDYDVDSGPPQAVQLGSSYLDDPGALVVKISAVIRHPKYKQRRSYYDIALIKLVQTVTFSEVIRPACLGVPPPVGKHIIATGWGRTEFGGDHSQELRTVSLPVWNMGECREIWGTSLKLPNGPTPDSHMCAGDKRGGKDTCQGDSGGPAQIQDGCVWRIVAVTSYGRSCGAPNTPALYAIVQRAFVAAQVFGDQDLDTRPQGYGDRSSYRRY